MRFVKQIMLCPILNVQFLFCKQSLFSAALLYSPMTGLKRRSTHSHNEHNEGLHSGNFWHIHITIEHHHFYTMVHHQAK